MKFATICAAASLLALTGCTTNPSYGIPTPGSYNPLATRQPVDPGQVAIAREVDKIDRTVDEGRESGQISRREARGLRRANGALAGAAGRMGADGLSADEQRGLQTQAQIIDSQAQAAKFLDDPAKPK